MKVGLLKEWPLLSHPKMLIFVLSNRAVSFVPPLVPLVYHHS